MIKNILRTTLRSILKYKAYSAINILGLAIGFTAFILISLYIEYEFSWDQHNENYDRIYRLQRRLHLSGSEPASTDTPAILKKLMQDRYPEIEEFLLVYETSGEFISISRINPFFDEDGIYAEQSIFDIFNYQFIEGNKASALLEPLSIVLSESMAKKLFPGESALDKTVLIEKKYSLKVTGVYSDLPENSTIRPSYIISFSSVEQVKNWQEPENSWNTLSTYVLLKNGADQKILNTKIARVLQEYPENEDVTIYLNPLSLLYLKPTDDTYFMLAFFMYGLIAVIILILSSFNYINLTTANSSIRAREIAVRKVYGSHNVMLIYQFLCESVLIALAAVFLAFLFTEILLPVFREILKKDLDLTYADNWRFILEIISIALLVGLLSGIYPGVFMSSKNTVDLLKGNLFRGKINKIGLRKILVIFQFSVSVFLILLTLIVTLQIGYLLNKDLGFNKEYLLFTNFTSTRNDGNFDDLRNRIMIHPEIVNASTSADIPVISFNREQVNWEGALPDEKIQALINFVSCDFIKNFEMTIIKGRNFSPDFPSDIGKACIINETAWNNFGWSDPIDKLINNDQWKVVGIVKDFHPYAVHDEIPPCIMVLQPGSLSGNWTYTFRILQDKVNEAKDILTKEFEAYFPNDPFEFHLYDDEFHQEVSIKAYETFNNTFFIFSVLAIILSVIGLLGFTSFITKRRTKEICIRKINGCKPRNVFLMLTRDYLILLLLSSLIAWPVAYIVYPFVRATYKRPLHIWEFLTATGIIFIIVLLTTIYHTLKASRSNPADVLRYE